MLADVALATELPDPLDDAAIEAMIADGTATPMGPAIIIRGRKLTMEEWVARNAWRAASG
jgi:hypothetical protein